MNSISNLILLAYILLVLEQGIIVHAKLPPSVLASIGVTPSPTTTAEKVTPTISPTVSHRPTLSRETSRWNASTELVIVPAAGQHPVDWLEELGYPVVACEIDGGAAPSKLADGRCEVPSHSREAAVYLKWIYVFYDELPKNVLFLHGHRLSAHQGPIENFAPRIQKFLKALTSKKHSFLNIGYQAYHFWTGCRELKLSVQYVCGESSVEWTLIQNPEFWNNHFKKFTNGTDIPTEVYTPAHAQFMVTRERIRQRPREAWKHWLDMLTSTDASFEEERLQWQEKLSLKNPHSSTRDRYFFVLGAVFEVLWAFILGENFFVDLPLKELDF